MERRPFIIAEIIKKSLVNDLNTDEVMLLEEWIAADPNNAALYRSFRDAHTVDADLVFLSLLDVESSWQKVHNRSNEDRSNEELNKGRQKLFKLWIPLIASCTLLFMYIAFIKDAAVEKDSSIAAIVSDKHLNDINPASQKATLILSDGESMVLNDDKDLKIADHVINKDHLLEYKPVADADLPLRYNTLVIPKGAFYALQLSDGTKVWLNAMSKIRFPEFFKGSERRVEISGEAYFEVSKDLNRPFIVEANGTEVKVLGTQFNVQAYTGIVKTTLKEGRVQINNRHEQLILSPGEFVESSHFTMQKGQADLDKELAWRNHEFYFKGDKLQDVTNQLANWYDLEIKFALDVKKNKLITGSIDRDVPLSQVLEMLEYISDLSFKIKGKQLLIETKTL